MKYLLSILVFLFFGCTSKSTIVLEKNDSPTSPIEVFLKLDTGGHTVKITKILVTKSGDIISASNDKTIRVWDSKTGKEKRKILGEIGVDSGKIFTIALSPNEKYLAVGGLLNKDQSLKEVIRIYHYKTGKLLKILKFHTHPIYSLAFSSDNKYLLSGAGDATVKIWLVDSFSLLDTIKFHINNIEAIEIFQENNQYFAVIAGYDNDSTLLTIYDIENKETRRKIKINFKPQYLALSKKHIAVCGIGKTIQIYDHSLNLIQTINSEVEPTGLSYSPNRKFLIAGDVNTLLNSINIYSVNENYKKKSSFKKHTNLTKAVAFLDDKTAISGGGNNNEIYIWDRDSNQTKRKISGVGTPIWNVGIKNKHIAWEVKKKNIDNTKFLNTHKTIDLQSFFIKKMLKVKDAQFNQISYNKDGYSILLKKDKYGYIVALGLQKEGKIVSIIRKNPTNGVVHHRFGFYKKFVISAGANGFLQIYNRKGRIIANLVGHTGDIFSIALDGDILVSGSSDETIRIWDLSKLRVNNVKLKMNEKFISTAMKQFNISRESIIRQGIEKEDLRLYLNFPTLYPKLNLFITKDNEWITWTKEGYFNASEKGVQYLYFHANYGENKEAKAIPMERLYDHFYRPDLIQLKLDGEEQAYREAIGILDFKKAFENPAPEISILTKAQTTNKNKITLSYNINDEGKGVGLIRVYHEGKLIKTIGEGKVQRASANKDVTLMQNKINDLNQQSDKVETYLASKSINKSTPIPSSMVEKTKIDNTQNKAGENSIEIELQSGSNEIAMEVFNKSNTIASYRPRVVINANIPKHKPKLYAIVAGINEFKGANFKSLKYAENDAKSIKNRIEQKMDKVFDEVKVFPLYGKEVTKDKILEKIKEIKQKVHLEDTILFYISTHGRVGEDKKLYLVTSNSEDGRNWLDFEKTFREIQSIKALNQIFIVDACESGKANDMVSAIYDSRISRLAKSSGVHMLMATSRGAKAYEHPDTSIKNGVFTHRILEALDDRTTDTNENHFISIKELSAQLNEAQDDVDFQRPIIRNVGRDVELERVE